MNISMGEILLLGFFLFIIIACAVRLAINPLMEKSEEVKSSREYSGLIDLRNIGLVSERELEEIIKLYSEKGVKKEKEKEFKKYLKVLDELKEMGYYTYDEYASKIEFLKSYLDIDDI